MQQEIDMNQVQALLSSYQNQLMDTTTALVQSKAQVTYLTAIVEQQQKAMSELTEKLAEREDVKKSEQPPAAEPAATAKKAR